MQSTRTRDATANFTPPKNWDAERDGPCFDLQVRVEPYSVYNQFTSTWKPSAQDIAHIIAGGVIELHMVGTMCPVALEVVDPVDVVTIDEHRFEAKRPSVVINEHGHGFDEHGPATP